jgi:F0F1-type ATP synthase beta subunit
VSGVGEEHRQVVGAVRAALGRAKQLTADATFLELLACRANRRAAERLAAFLPQRLAELSPEDRRTVERARKLQRFLTQPFFTAEPYTGTPGVFVPLTETLRGCREILEGRYDDVPESAFLRIGRIEEARQRAATS